MDASSKKIEEEAGTLLQYRRRLIKTGWMKTTLTLLGVAAMIYCLIYYFEPRFYLSLCDWGERKDGHSLDWPLNHLKAMGNRAIWPTISYLRDRESWAFPGEVVDEVLEADEEPAHRELVRAIKAEHEPLARASLIYALQERFRDYDCLLLWPGFTEGRPEYGLWLEHSLEARIDIIDTSDLPSDFKIRRMLPLPKQGQDAKAFWAWYHLHSRPLGPLPPLQR